MTALRAVVQKIPSLLPQVAIFVCQAAGILV